MEKRITESFGRQRDQSQWSKNSAYEKRPALEEMRKNHQRFHRSASDNVISSSGINPETLNQTRKFHRGLSRSASDSALSSSSTNPTAASELGQRRDHDYPQPETQRALEILRKALKRRYIDKLVEESKPESYGEAREAFEKFENIHRDLAEAIEKKKDISIDESRSLKVAFEELLGHLSPETLQDFKKRDVEFVIKRDAEVFYLVVKKNADSKRQVELPIPYKYPIRGMVLRTFDQLLEIYQQRDDSKVGEGETLLSSRTQMFDASNSPVPIIRAAIATRAFLANEKLGKHGFPIEGYGMAEMYHHAYEAGVRQAIGRELITRDTPTSERIKIGHEHARLKYLESIQPKGDIPLIFPTMQPGSYFEESSIPELKGGPPAKVGSPEFDSFMKDLMVRKQKGDNFTITANILPSGEVMAQPFFITESSRSGHAQNTKGGHCVWSGEVDIDYETKKILRIKDQSGHYRTFDKANPYRMIRYALKKFQSLGYDTSKAEIELTSIVGPKEVPYKDLSTPYS